jgi:hypothetical protein
LQDNKNNILSIKEEVKQSFIKHKQEMEIAISGVYSALNKALANIPKPEVPSYDSLKQEVDKKLEPASLDAKNANLRSSNNEIKLVILEKKIEQLQLLLNKLQLQG